MDDKRRDKRILSPAIASMVADFNEQIARLPMVVLAQQISVRGQQIAQTFNQALNQALSDIKKLEREGRKDTDIDEMSLLSGRIWVAVEIDAQSQIWRTFRQLRKQLQDLGMSEEEAIDRIRAMTHEEFARGNVPPRDAMIARWVDRIGRDPVRRALKMSATTLRQALKRAKP